MDKKGVDVSDHNGNVDWQALRNNGYEFGLIRCGWGMDTERQDDGQYINNVKKCEELGIPYGVYFYSYALKLDSIYSEINHALRLLKKTGKNFKLGIWFDMEDADSYKKNRSMPSNETLVEMCNIFCSNMEKAGYYTGIYADLNWLTKKLNSSKLDRFDKWVAQWYSKCQYNKQYSIWQYTNNAKINGKRFDANHLYKNIGGAFDIKPDTKKHYEGVYPKLPARGYFYYPGYIVDKGIQVKNLQKLLNWASNTKLDIDGYLGPDTKKAIIIYQKQYGLVQDGCFGPACLAKAKTITK